MAEIGELRLHSVLGVEATHLIGPEVVHESLVELVRVLIVQVIHVYLLLQAHVCPVRGQGYPMVHARMPTHVALPVEVLPRTLRVTHLVNGSDLVSDLHLGLLTRVTRVEGLVVGEAVQVLVVLLVDLHVVFAVHISLKVVEELEEHLQSD